MANFKKIQVKFSSNECSHYYFEEEQCLYIVNKIRKAMYLNCAAKSCKCKAKIIDNLMTRTNLEMTHNHNEHSYIAEFELAYDELKKEVENSSLPIRRLHRIALRNLSREAAGLFNWNNVRSTLQRIRRMNLPVCRNYNELCALMENNNDVTEKYGKIRGENFFQGSVDGNMIFANPFLISALEDNFEMFIDATFKVTPFHTKQLLIIMSTITNKPLPIIYIIMTEKSEKAYSQIFEFIETAVLPGNGCLKSPSSAIMDFELALRNSVKKIWPDIEVRGCNFHLCQSFLRKAKNIPSLSKKLKKKNSLHHQTLKMFMRLSLMPMDLVKRGIESLMSFIQNNPVLKRDFDTFTEYFTNVWLVRYSIEDWNVSKCRYRTNNVIEGYNSKVKKWICVNPSAWDFLETLVDLALDADSAYMNRLQKGKREPSTDLSKLTPTLDALLPQLNSGEISDIKFLKEMASAGKVPNMD